MQIAARVGAWTPSNEPLPYDAEVEYLQGDGVRTRINTGILPDDSVDAEIKFTIVKPPSSSYCIWGGGGGWVFDYVQLSHDAFDRVNSAYGNSNSYVTNCFNNETVVMRGNKNKIYKNGSLVFTFREAMFSSQYPINLFAYNRSGAYGEYSKDKLHYFKCSKNENLIIDLIPVRFTNENGVSEGAMYDRVSGQLFRNAGTGAFVIGPDKVGTELAGGGGV